MRVRPRGNLPTDMLNLKAPVSARGRSVQVRRLVDRLVCAMTDADYQLINLRYSCPLLRREDLLTGKVPTAPTISSMIGGLQAQEALKLIHGMPVAEGAALVFNGASNQFYKTNFQHREDCLSHETYDAPIELPLSVREHTAADLFSAVHEHLDGDRTLKLSLDRDLVVSIDCAACEVSQSVLKPIQLVGMSQAKCPECKQPARPNTEHVVHQGSDLANEKLADLGVPPYDIVRVGDNQQEQVFLLSADREQVMHPTRL